MSNIKWKWELSAHVVCFYSLMVPQSTLQYVPYWPVHAHWMQTNLSKDFYYIVGSGITPISGQPTLPPVPWLPHSHSPLMDPRFQAPQDNIQWRLICLEFVNHIYDKTSLCNVTANWISFELNLMLMFHGCASFVYFIMKLNSFTFMTSLQYKTRKSVP